MFKIIRLTKEIFKTVLIKAEAGIVQINIDKILQNVLNHPLPMVYNMREIKSTEVYCYPTKNFLPLFLNPRVRDVPFLYIESTVLFYNAVPYQKN